MPSITIATRTKGRRCAACNQFTETWICDACAFNSLYYRARFNDDTRASSPTKVGKCGRYPSPATEYRSVPSLPALTESDRLATIRRRVEASEETITQRLALLQKLRTQATTYDKIAQAVNANTRRRELAPPPVPPEHWNYVRAIDPRRWCDDCIGARIHRAGCPLIELEGPYVGGYPDDGTHVQARKRFVPLRTPGAHWQPLHHRQHARAVARRWQAFRDVWAKIGLDYLTRMIEARGKKVRPPQAPNTQAPKKRRGRPAREAAINLWSLRD